MKGLVCDISGLENCTDCRICEDKHEYGSCYNCKLRHPLMIGGAGTSDRCRTCYKPPLSNRYMQEAYMSDTGWVCDGGVEINAVSNAVYEFHSSSHSHEIRVEKYKRLLKAIKLLDSFAFVEL